jgi:hypothetical protein
MITLVLNGHVSPFRVMSNFAEFYAKAESTWSGQAGVVQPDDCRVKSSAHTAAMLLILFDDEVVGHARDVIADHAGQGFLAGLLLIIGGQS